jgi:hypothetical protein
LNHCTSTTRAIFKVILLACTDNGVLFTTVHVKDFGKNSNGSVFKACTLGEMLEEEELHISFPTSRSLDDSGEAFPYYSVAEDAFPIKMDLTRPYPKKC